MPDPNWLLGFSVAFVIALISGVIGFLIGIITYWFGTRKDRRLLKRYREREQQRRSLSRPIE
ncbi:MAG TPA: hypothetical protein VFA10_30195 [Ktedonobacteraceae bacterium]|nr:hypothetical protein [Ktedonobacteraceae bacterium]